RLTRLTHARLSFFSLYSSVPLPHLHSFPTRRSSDLANVFHFGLGCRELQPIDNGFLVRVTAEFLLIGKNRIEIRKCLCKILHNRSEEHTSELQSRSDLVCRLLLEKKKKKNDEQ